MSRIVSEIHEGIEESEKISVTHPQDMYDRVINLGFAVTDKESKIMDYYVLRSDYEIGVDAFKTSNIYKKNFINKGYIRKCTYKPSIRVNFTKLKNNSISIDLYIDNFYMISKSGRISRNLSGDKYHVDYVTIAMGYFSQFREPENYADYYYISEYSGQGISIIKGRPTEFIQAQGEPPNSATHIKVVYGDISNSPVEIVTAKKPDYKVLAKNTLTSNSKVADVMEEAITMRFLNYSKVNLDTDFGQASYREFLATVKTAKESKQDVTQLPSYRAYMYIHGVKVNLTDKANSLPVVPELTDSEGNSVVSKLVPFNNGTTILHTLSILNRQFGWDLKCLSLDNGELLIFRREELKDVTQLAEEAVKGGLYEGDVFSKFYHNKLPCVYSITKEARSVNIKCPFFAFMSPLHPVEFKTDYGDLGVTLDIMSKANVTKFYVISQTVDFATVDDINDVILKGTVKGE
jgi:hypothetical protein